MTTSTFGLGLIGLYDDPILFKYTAIVLRFFQGTGDTLLQITCYSIITNVFSDDIMKYITYIEITVGVGLGLGPSLGSAVYGTL
jgi:MFS family permease